MVCMEEGGQLNVSVKNFSKSLATYEVSQFIIELVPLYFPTSWSLLKIKHKLSVKKRPKLNNVGSLRNDQKEFCG